MFLNPDEIKQLTGKMRSDAQVRWLRTMGITHKINGNGDPIILKAHIEKVFDGSYAESKNKEEPNWNAINA